MSNFGRFRVRVGKDGVENPVTAEEVATVISESTRSGPNADNAAWVSVRLLMEIRDLLRQLAGKPIVRNEASQEANAGPETVGEISEAAEGSETPALDRVMGSGRRGRR